MKIKQNQSILNLAQILEQGRIGATPRQVGGVRSAVALRWPVDALSVGRAVETGVQRAGKVEQQPEA